MDLYLANVGLQRVHCRYHGGGEVLLDMPPLSQVQVLADAEQYTVDNAVALYAGCGAVDASALGNRIVGGLVTGNAPIDVASYIDRVAALNPLYAGRLGTALAEQGSTKMPSVTLVPIPNITLAA